jgi:hypothetical protein
MNEGEQMARDGIGSEYSGRKFGRVDPFCWIAVIPMLLVAVGVAVLGGVGPALIIAVVAVILVILDSYINRNSHRGSPREPYRGAEEWDEPRRSPARQQPYRSRAARF